MSDDRKLTEDEAMELLNALKGIQKMQGELNAKKRRPLSDEEVQERVNRKDYGLSADNPIILDNVPFAYALLDNIKSPSGTPFVKEQRSSVFGSEGHMVDVYDGYYLDESGKKVKTTIYVDCYCSRSVAAPPHGWRGKNQDVNHAAKKGCLLPLMAFIAAGLMIGSALACVL